MMHAACLYSAEGSIAKAAKLSAGEIICISDVALIERFQSFL